MDRDHLAQLVDFNTKLRCQDCNKAIHQNNEIAIKLCDACFDRAFVDTISCTETNESNEHDVYDINDKEVKDGEYNNN